MKIKLLIAFIIVLILVGVLLFLNLFPFKPQQKPTNQTQSTQQEEAKNYYKRPNATFSYTKSGFVPQRVTVKTGEEVTWTNNSGEDMSLNSADHPTHVKFPILNIGTIPDGATGVVVFKEKGTYSFHDHYKPEHTGIVIVE